MFNLSWNHTFTVHDGPNVVARCCSFKACPMKEGDRCFVHKGKLLCPLENTDAVVKAYHGQDSNPGSKAAATEVKKYHVIRSVLRQCSETTNGTLKLIRTLESQVDKVGKGGRLREKTAGRRRSLSEGDSVVVQDFVPGHVQELFSLALSQTSPCQTSPSHTQDTAPCFLELTRKSYSLSGGRHVISAVKGVAVPGRRKSRGGPGVTFRLTSLTIHSRDRQFGEKDMGVYGVEMYERWSGLGPRGLPASAPPLEVFTEAEDSSSCPRNTDSVFHWPTPSSRQPAPWEGRTQTDNVFHWPTPSSRQPASWEDKTPQPPPAPLPGLGVTQTSCSARQQRQSGPAGSDAVDGSPGEGGPPPLLVRRPTLAEVLATAPELRSCCPDWLVNQVLGPAPAYSYHCDNRVS